MLHHTLVALHLYADISMSLDISRHIHASLHLHADISKSLYIPHTQLSLHLTLSPCLTTCPCLTTSPCLATCPCLSTSRDIYMSLYICIWMYRHGESDDEVSGCDDERSRCTETCMHADVERDVKQTESWLGWSIYVYTHESIHHTHESIHHARHPT